MSEARWNFEEGTPIAPGRLALSRLGGGPQHEVYLVWDDRLLALAVAKLIRPDQVDNKRVLEGLRGEARILSSIAHPVIVRLFDAVDDGDRPHLLLEHLEGPTLGSLLRRYGPIQMPQVLPLALHLCSAIHYLATSGLVHLDVKPYNVVMGAPPRMIDLSLARSLEDAARVDHQVGTRAYMAPEQCEPGGRGRIGTAADMWGLGMVLYEALTGELPFEDGGEGFPQLADPARLLPPDVPTQVAEPVMACLAPDPDERPRPAELAHVLEPLVAVLPRPRVGRPRPRLR